MKSINYFLEKLIGLFYSKPKGGFVPSKDIVIYKHSISCYGIQQGFDSSDFKTTIYHCRYGRDKVMVKELVINGIPNQEQIDNHLEEAKQIVSELEKLKY